MHHTPTVFSLHFYRLLLPNVPRSTAMACILLVNIIRLIRGPSSLHLFAVTTIAFSELRNTFAFLSDLLQ